MTGDLGRCPSSGAALAGSALSPCGASPSAPAANAMLEIGDELVRLGVEKERAAVIVWLCDRCLNGVEHTLEWPMWRKLLWAAAHPITFIRTALVSQLVIEINRGDHAPAIANSEATDA